LADRAILVNFEQNGEAVYALPPPMAFDLPPRKIAGSRETFPIK
jgi:hypothetical protein